MITKPKATDLSHIPNIVSAYTFIPVSGIVVDVAGGGNNGTIVGAVSTSEGLYFSSNSAYITLGDIGNVKTIAFRIKPASTTEKIMEGAAADLLVHISSGTLTYSEFDNAFINGVDSDAMFADQWQNVVIVSSTDVDFSACTLGLNDATYGEFEIADLRFFNYQFSAEEAQEYHSSFQKLEKRGNFSDHPVGSTI